MNDTELLLGLRIESRLYLLFELMKANEDLADNDDLAGSGNSSLTTRVSSVSSLQLFNL